MAQDDIRIGRATVPHHQHGGWALPGRVRTESFHVASRVAARIDALIPVEMTPASILLEKSRAPRKAPERRYIRINKRPATQARVFGENRSSAATGSGNGIRKAQRG